MPDGRTHKIVGAATGTAFAAYRAREQRGADFFGELLGGALGGCVGGILPDVFEPATSSWHRDLAHSWTAGGGLFALNQALTAFEKGCRDRAKQSASIPMLTEGNFYAAAPIDPWAQFSRDFSAFLWRFLAGFVNGLAAGYASHLVLDAATPRSLPLLTTSF